MTDTLRNCQTCKHVLGGKVDTFSGQVTTIEKCKKFRVGRNFMQTWTATHRENLCGPTLKKWEPQS